MIVTDVATLRLPCVDVKDMKEGGEIARKLSAELVKLNKKAINHYRKTFGKEESLVQGVGLAAPQIGIHKKVCLIKPFEKPLVLMNPVIINVCPTKIKVEEGCLSLPGQKFEVWRHVWIMVRTLNLGDIYIGSHLLDKVKTLEAIVAQHEIAHLYGLLPSDFTDQNSELPR